MSIGSIVLCVFYVPTRPASESWMEAVDILDPMRNQNHKEIKQFFPLQSGGWGDEEETLVKMSRERDSSQALVHEKILCQKNFSMGQ